MFGKSKVKKAFDQKQRTRKEVDSEYTQQAIFLGHKSRIVAQMYEEITRIEGEIKGHLDKLLELNQEGVKLPPEEAPAPAPVAQEEAAK